MNLNIRLRKVPRTIWILLAITLIGIFLRTYNFRDWMRFEGDQSRDATVADNVLSGKANWPLLGPHMNHTTFKLGAIYYQFQIISAKIFGHTPESVAYPDLFFSILSIPLLFFLLRRYFSENLSLAMTGLYSVLYFSIKYSRFAWNINPIPFFIFLFILALLDFWLNKEKTQLRWIVGLGIGFGVGIQLHAILFFLLPTILGIIFILIMKNHWTSKNLWSKWLLILAMVLALNFTQFVSEFQNNFTNTKTLTKLVYEILTKPEDIWKSFTETVVSHIETNTLMLSSYGDQDSIDFDYARLLSGKVSKYWKIIKNKEAENIIFVLGTIFSVFGYGMMIRKFKHEKEKEKKYFLGLLLLYVSLSFLVLLGVGNLLRPRYFIHTVFVPFIFIGFLINWLENSLPRWKKWILFLVISFFVIANLFSITKETKQLIQKSRSEDRYTVLGEVEMFVDYMITKSGDQKEIFISGSPGYIWEYYNPLEYIARKRGVSLIKTEHRNSFPQNKPVFYITPKSKEKTINGYQIENEAIFGNMIIYKLKT